MVLWAIFAVELAGLVTLGVQRSVAERRGDGAWLIRGAEPALERAFEAGERRQDGSERLPLSEPDSRQRLQNLALTASAVLSLPGAVAVIASDLDSEWCIPTFLLTGLLGTDVAVVMAVTVALWRGWLPLPDDGDDGDDFTRAHMFNLLR